MRKIITALALSTLALGGATAVQAKSKTGEEKLAELLDGRVAGEPKSCISTNRSDGLTVLDGAALVYKDGDTIWVNRTAHPKELDRMDTLVINRFSGSQLCKLDQVTTIDRGSGFFSGVVFLEDFVPYKKTES